MRKSEQPAATSATLAAVKPKCSNSFLAGADAPNVSMPMTAPSRPT